MDRKLGTGNEAIVYHVCEALCHSPPSEDDRIHSGGHLELNDTSTSRSPTISFGPEYTIKLLSRANLDEDKLVA